MCIQRSTMVLSHRTLLKCIHPKQLPKRYGGEAVNFENEDVTGCRDQRTKHDSDAAGRTSLLATPQEIVFHIQGANWKNVLFQNIELADWNVLISSGFATYQYRHCRRPRCSVSSIL